MSYENAIFQWEEGIRKLNSLSLLLYPVAERVTSELVAELHRRLGGSFSVAELVNLYYEGTDWCLSVAMEIAPNHPNVWEPEIIDAAFAMYLREASDYAGGKRVEE